MTGLLEDGVASSPAVTHETLVELRELVVDYVLGGRRVRAVDDVNLTIGTGEIVGLAGESGCGKSTIANAVMQLLRPPAQMTSGEILFRGEDLTKLSTEKLRQFRWRNVSMVFQSAMNSLNPLMRVGDQFVDMMKAHEKISKRRRPRARRPSCSSSSAWTAVTFARIRTSSRAACASA